MRCSISYLLIFCVLIKGGIHFRSGGNCRVTSNPQIRQFCCCFIPFSSIFPPMFPDFAHWFSWFAAPGSSLDIFINFGVLIIWGGAEFHGFMNKHQYRDEFIHWMDAKYKSAISWIFISFLQCWSYQTKVTKEKKTPNKAILHVICPTERKELSPQQHSPAHSGRRLD